MSAPITLSGNITGEPQPALVLAHDDRVEAGVAVARNVELHRAGEVITGGDWP